MNSHLRIIIGLMVGSAALSILAGLMLGEPELTWLARILTQSGTPNPSNMEKLRLLPLPLLITGAQSLILVLLETLCRQPISRAVLILFAGLTGRQKAAFLFGAAYLLIAVVTLDYGSVSLGNRIFKYRGLSNQEVVALDYGKDFTVVKTLQQKTPETAHIFIRTRNDLKYLLNYDLYPRRFYFYPEGEAGAGSIPMAWWGRYRIDWTLDIDDQDPSRFILMERRGIPLAPK